MKKQIPRIIIYGLLLLYMVYPFEPRVVESKKVLKALSFFSKMEIIGHAGAYPYIIVHDLSDKETINHEMIHFYQHKDLRPLITHIVYASLYIYNRLKGLDDFEAYYYNCYEQEAYYNEVNPDYLKTRKKFAQFDYFIK